jgi:hypothetical protein
MRSFVDCKSSCAGFSNLMLVWYGLQPIGGDDGEDGHNEGVGAPHYDRQPCPKQRLEQGVDSGGEDERLDDSSLVVLIAVEEI